MFAYSHRKQCAAFSCDLKFFVLQWGSEAVITPFFVPQTTKKVSEGVVKNICVTYSLTFLICQIFKRNNNCILIHI